MDREEFGRRLRLGIERAAAEHSRHIGREVVVPERVIIDAGLEPRHEASISEAEEELYLGPEASYVFIDVAIRVGGPDRGKGWLRASSHQPSPYSETWDADGIGPFKAIGGVGNRAEWDEVGGFPSSA